MSKKIKEIKIATILFAVLILIASYLLVVVILLYGFGVENNFVKKTLKFLPFPAAFVGGTSYISISELENNLSSLRSFYEKEDFSSLGYRIDFNTADGQKRLKIKEKNLLNKLIENKIIDKLAKEKGIEIDPEVLSKEADNRLEQYGSKDEIAVNLKKIYGWSIADFTEKIARPELQRKELEKYLRINGQKAKVSLGKIKQAEAELKSGKLFVEVVKKYSEGESAEKYGELGWFSADQMIPEIALTVSLLEKGATSDILESPLGYHIINVEDKKIENGVAMAKIRQIFVRSENFSDWLLEQEKNSKIYIPLHDFSWDKEQQLVKFKNKELEEFEKNLGENSAGDISVMPY